MIADCHTLPPQKIEKVERLTATNLCNNLKIKQIMKQQDYEA